MSTYIPDFSLLFSFFIFFNMTKFELVGKLYLENYKLYGRIW